MFTGDVFCHITINLGYGGICEINSDGQKGNVLKERTTDIENLLGQISDLPEVSSALNETRKMLSNLDYLNGLLPQTVTHDASDVGDDVHHYDNYRWFVTVVVLTWCVFLCIYSFWIGCQTTDCVMAMLTILCLSSVLFTWIVLGGDFGIATGIGDLCVHPVKSMEQIKKGNPAVVEYYANCNKPDPFKNNLSLLEKEVEILRDLIENIPGQKSVTRRILNDLDNFSYRLPRYEESFTCLKIHKEYMDAMDGLCNKALNSLALVMLSLLILAFVSGLMTCAVCPLWRYRKSYDRAYPNVTVNRERMGNDDILWWPHGAETNTEETHLRRQGNVTHDERSPLIANQHQPYYETVNHSNLNNIQPNSSSNGPAADGRYARGDGQNISHKPGDYQRLDLAKDHDIFLVFAMPWPPESLFAALLQILLCCTSSVSGEDNSTSQAKVDSRISVFWTGFEAEDSTARLLKLIGLICIVSLTFSLVCCCLCSFRKSKKTRKWVLVERVGFSDDEFSVAEQHDNGGMQMTDLRDERKQLTL